MILRILKINLAAIIFLTTVSSWSQCIVNVSPITVTIDCGASVDLSAIGLSALPALATDFNNNALGPGWQTTATVLYSNPCGPSLDGTPSAWLGNVPLPKTLTTVGFDMNCGGQVCFDLDFGGDESASVNDCEDPDELDEGVYFQYSIDNGVNWVDIFYFEPTDDISGPYYNWANYCFTLPPAAWSTNTMFQWDQPEVTSSVNDHWGIDNVIITPTDCGYWYNWDNVPGLNDAQTQTVSPLETTTYNVIYTNGSDSCNTDVLVEVLPLIVDVTATSTNLNCNECTDLNLTLTNPPTNVCQEIASANGQDVSVDVTINSFSCAQAGSTITSVILDGNIGGNCPSWYDFDVIIDGTTVQSGLCNTAGLDLSSYLPFSSVTLSANDNDSYSDNVTLDLILNITYTTNPVYDYSWTPSGSINNPNIQSPNACPISTTTYVGTLTEQNSGCTASDSIEVVYNCAGCNLSNDITVNDCDSELNTYSINGTLTFSGQPTIGFLYVKVNNGSSDYDTVISPPFISGVNWSISGIPADGAASTVSTFFMNDAGCSATENYVAPDPCVTCTSDVGTFSTTITGNSTTDYILCFGDELNITTNSDWLGPIEQTNPPGPNYDVGVSWMIFSCPPSVGVLPNATNTITDDPCFVSFMSDFNVNDVNDLSLINSFPTGTFTNNIIYWVPITMYSLTDNSFSYVNGALPCYNVGSPIAVQYLTDYNTTIIEDCQTQTATVTINGSLPQINGTNFTVSNLLPTTASFQNTTATNNGNVIINGLNGGEMYSFDVVDENGCPHTINAGPFPSAPIPSFIANPLSGCEPLFVEFTNTTGIESQNCEWDFGNGITANGCGSVSTVYNQGVFDVTLTVTSNSGCTATVTYEEYINVQEQPVASFSYSPHFTDVENTLVEMENSSLFADSYLWSYSDNSGSETTTDPTHEFPGIAGSYAITLVAYNEDMTCSDTIQQTVIIQDIVLFYVPNIFTPDFDDFNQTFYPVFTSGYDPFDYHLIIFNRWGETVFESYDPSHGWNGQYGNGDIVQDGVYIWTIDFKETMSDKRHKVTGHVSVLK